MTDSDPKMSSVDIVPTKNRDQIKIEELQFVLQSERQQVAEMTLDLEDLKLEVRHFQKTYDLNYLLKVSINKFVIITRYNP